MNQFGILLMSPPEYEPRKQRTLMSPRCHSSAATPMSYFAVYGQYSSSSVVPSAAAESAKTAMYASLIAWCAASSANLLEFVGSHSRSSTSMPSIVT